MHVPRINTKAQIETETSTRYLATYLLHTILDQPNNMTLLLRQRIQLPTLPTRLIQQQKQHRLFTQTRPTSTPPVIDTIKTDHRELETYFHKIVSTTDPTEQTKWQNQFTWELARHSVGEELIVYPAFEKYVEGGMGIAERERGEHQGVSFPPSRRPSLLGLS